MNKFKLLNHRVLNATFNSNIGKDCPSTFPVKIEGGILIPHDGLENDTISVKLDLTLGNKDNEFLLVLETISVFNVLDCNVQISTTEVNRYCIPVALKELRNTIKNVTTAFGIPPVDLPPFSEESELTVE